jgi:hypothetical protein
MYDEITCGVTIMRRLYTLTFGEDYAGSDDSIFDILETFSGLPPVRDLDYRARAALVAIMRSYSGE